MVETLIWYEISFFLVYYLYNQITLLNIHIYFIQEIKILNITYILTNSIINKNLYSIIDIIFFNCDNILYKKTWNHMQIEKYIYSHTKKTNFN